MPKELTQAGIQRKAAFASLDGRALTPGAKNLVAEVNTWVVAQVALGETKPGGVKTNRKKLRAATEAFLADLLIARSVRVITTVKCPAGLLGLSSGRPMSRGFRALGDTQGASGTQERRSDPICLQETALGSSASG
jgi:hypothetical protein